MALTLTLDYTLRIVADPGFYQRVTTRQLAELGNPKDADSHYGLWRDEITKTLMLRPRQLDPAFLNSPDQLDSIIRLDDLVVNAADLASQSIFEAAAFGNNANPYVFHVPVGPSDAFPGAAPGELVPGAAPSLVGVDTPVDATIPKVIFRVPDTILEPLPVLPAPPYDPTIEIGDTADGKFLGHSKERLPANRGLLFRWFHPASQPGYPCTYEFYVGQYRLRVKDVVIEVFRDTSDAGDRSAWKKVQVFPAFSQGDFSPTGVGSVVEVTPPNEILNHDRSLLWLPFRRNQVLLVSSAGKSAVLPVNATPRRLPDDSDWDIVREDSLMVWVLTPAPGRFQIQQLKYRTGAVIQSPTITLDYTPAAPPTVTVSGDADHGTSISAVRSGPPSYTLPTNDLDDCPPDTTTGTDLRQKYGVELTFNSSGDRRWTPFFYGFDLSAPRTFANSPATPVTVDDENALPAIISAEITAGLSPGEGRLTVEVLDAEAQNLAAFYYRSGYPVRLSDGATVLFTGLSESNQVTPLKETGTPLRLSFAALDLWKLLGRGGLRDQRDWTGFGHIDVVKFIAEQGGIDTTGAEFPAGYTPGVISVLNSRLGLADPTVTQEARDVEQGWRPRDDDTPATYIKRVAELYSGWDVGFRLDGTFFYLPKDYFTASSVTFNSTNAGGFPLFYGPPAFIPEEPEANVILVKAASAQTGQVGYSSLWVDWASITNPAAPNYLGYAKRQVVVVGGSFSCAQRNWIARKVWEQTRRLKIKVDFEADFVPGLKVGQVVTLAGYGTYRIKGFTARLTKETQHRATYHAESTVRGY